MHSRNQVRHGSVGARLVGVALGIALLLPAGCGGSDTKTRTVQVAPIVVIQPIPRQVGDVTIDYTLLDPNGGSADIVVETSTDGGAIYALATQGFGGDGTTGLPSSVSGINYTYVWDSMTDIGSGAFPQVKIRITPSDMTGLDGLPAVSPNTIVGNDAPWLQVQTVPDSSGLVAVAYTLFDSTADKCSITVEFSTDGGVSFSLATIPGGATANLAAGSAGINHILAWNSLADIGSTSASTVVLQITPADAFDTGMPVMTNVFSVQNNSIPVAFMLPVPRQDGDVAVDFLLLDLDSDPIDILVEYSIDLGITFWVATLTPSSITTGLASSPTGSAHSIDWDSAADIGTGAMTAIIRVTPSDGASTGIPAETPPFIVGNDAPEIWGIPITGPEGGWVLIEFTLVDTTSDPVDVDCRFTTDGWVTDAACSRIIGPIIDAPSAPFPGVIHQVMWDSLFDLGLGTFNVELRFTPCDDETGIVECGLPILYGAFPVTN